MPIRSAIKDLVPDAQAWRREIHQNPGLMYDVETTAELPVLDVLFVLVLVVLFVTLVVMIGPHTKLAP